MKSLHQALFTLVLVSVLATCVAAQQGQGRGFRGGRGPGPNFGPGGGPGHAAVHAHDQRHDADHEVFQFLLVNHEKITRTVTELENGVDTLTESDDPKIAEKIREHVQWMEHRIEHTKPIRMRDPLFAELFRHTDKIRMERQNTPKGVRVLETSDDPKVVKLIQAHAKVVSAFVQRGMTEAMKNHPLPGNATQTAAFAPPTIENFGPVVQLPQATHQPRNESLVLVDLTKGGSKDKLFPSIEKVARFVNIYSGGGAQPATAKIAVVFHGDATLAVLNSDAYAQRFGTPENPNLELLHKLHEAGVELVVCGQSLAHEQVDRNDVAVFVDVGVSAMTALVNLQADGYAYVPLK